MVQVHLQCNTLFSKKARGGILKTRAERKGAYSEPCLHSVWPKKPQTSGTVSGLGLGDVLRG